MANQSRPSALEEKLIDGWVKPIVKAGGKVAIAVDSDDKDPDVAGQESRGSAKAYLRGGRDGGGSRAVRLFQNIEKLISGGMSVGEAYTATGIKDPQRGARLRRLKNLSNDVIVMLVADELAIHVATDIARFDSHVQVRLAKAFMEGKVSHEYLAKNYKEDLSATEAMLDRIA
jgi:hypothetical protein